MESENLINHIDRFVTLKESEIDLVKSAIRCQSFKKKEILLSNNQICRYNFFVIDGCLRMYVITSDGDEHTIQFALEDWWLTDYTSFEMQRPSEFNIQAIEKSQIIMIERDKQEALFASVPKLERYFRLIMQRAYAASLYRISLIYNLSKRDRYLNFINKFPGFAQRVPQYILGSYLGMSAEYISEIRNSLT
ncbi:MAG: Crp/Fnr family transcriptional regulator [Balneolaceae bacterium]|jgi:CRP-like cAMP-binding protein